MRAVALGLALLIVGACAQKPGGVSKRPAVTQPSSGAFIEDLERRTFAFFWERADPATGLVPDRWPTPSFSSVAAMGFGLTAYPIGAERGYVTREQARDRVLVTLRFLRAAPQGPGAKGVAGEHGFYYHFLDMPAGRRHRQVELSTIDTSLLLAGVLFCQSYFDGADPAEAEIRALADAIYRRVDWTWAQPRPPLVAMGWTPERGFDRSDWRGYDEAMILYVLALGSPTHPIDPAAWEAWTSSYRWGAFHGSGEHVGFAPLFGHQYSHTWIDLRGTRDAYGRSKGIDYFENARRATLAQRAYAIANPMGWRGYGADVWGLTACDGPIDGTYEVNGVRRRFFTYAARGADFTELRDDGTIAPTAAASSIAFAPEVVVPTLEAMRRRWPAIYGQYGFVDAFNPTFASLGVPPRMGRNDPSGVWVDGDYLGIDQGPIVAMIENYRSELVWRTMRRNPHVVRGLRRAGFTGGWLDDVRGS